MAANIIIIAILAMACVFAARGAYRHFTGKGACCGGGSDFIPEADKKLDGRIVEKKSLKIEGMTCENCVNRVKKAINSVDGAPGKVNLRKGTAEVVCDRYVSNDDIQSAIERAGYRAAVIK